MPAKDCALVFRFRSSGSGRFRGRLGVRSRRGGFRSASLRVLVVVLGLSAVSSLVTGFTTINTEIVVHSALLPARRRGSTRDGRRTDDTGGQAWERLPFLYKLCSILSGTVDDSKPEVWS